MPCTFCLFIPLLYPSWFDSVLDVLLFRFPSAMRAVNLPSGLLWHFQYSPLVRLW